MAALAHRIVRTEQDLKIFPVAGPLGMLMRIGHERDKEALRLLKEAVALATAESIEPRREIEPGAKALQDGVVPEQGS